MVFVLCGSTGNKFFAPFFIFRLPFQMVWSTSMVLWMTLFVILCISLVTMGQDEDSEQNMDDVQWYDWFFHDFELGRKWNYRRDPFIDINMTYIINICLFYAWRFSCPYMHMYMPFGKDNDELWSFLWTAFLYLSFNITYACASIIKFSYTLKIVFQL